MNNYFLPLWMIVFGVGLLRYGRVAPPAAETNAAPWMPAAQRG